MTVGQLRDLLETLPSDMLVLCSNDDELNGLHGCNPGTGTVEEADYGYEMNEDGDIEVLIL